MKTVSIIIPAYNAEAFIKNCIDSILAQSYKDFEIVIVNDGSKDSTLEIIKEYEKADNRIRVISKENGGVSSARNEGLKNASGDYVTFVDADDALTPTALEDMVSLMSDDTDFVVCSHNDIRFNKKPYIEIPAVYKADEIDKKFIEFDRVTWWPWAKLYRRSVISDNNLEYDLSVNFAEDHIFNLLFAKHIKGNVVVSDKVVYNYYCLRGGLCSKYYPDFNNLQKYVYLKIVDYFNGDISREYEKHYVGCYLKGCVDYYIAWLAPNKAAIALNETFELFSDIADEEILKEYFAPKQYELIKKKDYKALTVNYTILNPRKTVVRKIARKGRQIIEKTKVLKIFLKDY